MTETNNDNSVRKQNDDEDLWFLKLQIDEETTSSPWELWANWWRIYNFTLRITNMKLNEVFLFLLETWNEVYQWELDIELVCSINSCLPMGTIQSTPVVYKGKSGISQCQINEFNIK